MVHAEIAGIPILIEAVIEPGTEPTSSRSRPTDRTQELFKRAYEVIEQIATSTAELGKRIAAHTKEADKLEIQFGLKFSTQGNIIIAGIGAESSLNVKLTYSDALTQRKPAP